MNYGLELSRIKIEITETAIIEDFSGARHSMQNLTELGCQIVMDDFGTGYSSLTWLQSLPFSSIKIDSRFVQLATVERESRKIVSAVVGLGLSLGLSVVAEGVETVQQADLLRRTGCRLAQGYLFGKPASAEDIDFFIKNHRETTSVVKTERMSLEQRAYQISAIYHTPQTSICFLDSAFTIIDASEAFANRFCQNLANMIGRNLFEFANVSSQELNWLRSFRERDLPYPLFNFTRPDGGVDVVTLTTVMDEGGDLIGYSIVGIEIEKSKISRQKI